MRPRSSSWGEGDEPPAPTGLGTRSAAALVLPVLPDRIKAGLWLFRTARMHGALLRLPEKCPAISLYDAAVTGGGG